MINRELGLQEIHRRIKPLYNTITGMKQILRLPARAVDENDVPGIFIMEGNDEIIKRSNRDYLGYGCIRTLDVLIECWDYVEGSYGVRNVFEDVRLNVLANKGDLGNDVLIRELRTEGPYNSGIFNVLAMTAVFSMRYQDSGPNFS